MQPAPMDLQSARDSQALRATQGIAAISQSATMARRLRSEGRLLFGISQRFVPITNIPQTHGWRFLPNHHHRHSLQPATTKSSLPASRFRIDTDNDAPSISILDGGQSPAFPAHQDQPAPTGAVKMNTMRARVKATESSAAQMKISNLQKKTMTITPPSVCEQQRTQSSRLNQTPSLTLHPPIPRIHSTYQPRTPISLCTHNPSPLRIRFASIPAERPRDHPTPAANQHPRHARQLTKPTTTPPSAPH